MQLDTDIRYMKPKLVDVKHEVVPMELVTRKITHIIEDTIKDPTLKIPIRANFHPLGYRELIRLDNKVGGKVVSVATMLVTLLNSKSMNNTVHCSYEQLANLCEVSRRTIATTVPILEEHKFITREGKQGYRISAKLAWFGNQVDWAMELRRLREEEGFGADMPEEPLELAPPEDSKLITYEVDTFALELFGQEFIDMVDSLRHKVMGK